LGWPFEVGGACSVADRGNAHRRLRTEGSAKRGDDGPRLLVVDEFLLHAVGVRWLPLQQFRGLRERARAKTPCAIFAVCRRRRSGASTRIARCQGLQIRWQAADDVHDGVDCANFMEMNFFDGHVVERWLQLRRVLRKIAEACSRTLGESFDFCKMSRMALRERCLLWSSVSTFTYVEGTLHVLSRLSRKRFPSRKHRGRAIARADGSSEGASVDPKRRASCRR